MASRFSSMTTRMPSRIGLVADVGDALDLLLAHKLGDLLDHRRLVHLIGNLGDDQGFALLADESRWCTRPRIRIEPRPLW